MKIHRLLLSLLLIACVQAQAADAKKPNLVLFLSDDHGVDFADCYGNKAIRTPTILSSLFRRYLLISPRD